MLMFQLLLKLSTGLFFYGSALLGVVFLKVLMKPWCWKQVTEEQMA